MKALRTQIPNKNKKKSTNPRQIKPILTLQEVLRNVELHAVQKISLSYREH